MKIQQLFEKWGFTELKLNLLFLESTWQPQDSDKNAAWEMYVEITTRMTTQSLADSHGDEKAALSSVYELFSITRKILKHHGKFCAEFAKIAIPILNQIVRPFTAKWHRISEQNLLKEKEVANDFRKELLLLQEQLRKYTQLLAEIAGVEDLSTIVHDVS